MAGWLIAIPALALAGCIGGVEQSAPIETSAGTALPTAEQAVAAWDAFLAQGDAEAAQPEILDDPAAETPRVVVAVVDTGVNPFHEFFARPELLAPGALPLRAVDAVTGQAARYVPIRPIAEMAEGDWLADILEPERLYRFAGTNLLFYSMLDDVTAADYNGHGTATAGTVAHELPQAIVVMVQTDGGNLDRAVAWAAAQPWIDVISVSWGCLANCAWSYPAERAGLLADESARITREAHAAGKIVVNSAGNDPTPHWTDSRDGPPWVVAAGGADPYRRGEAWIAAKGAEVVSNFTVMAPRHNHPTEMRAIGGTSFACPTVAGTFARAILEARERVGHVGGIVEGKLVAGEDASFTNEDFRNALHRNAVYWTTTDYSPLATHPSGSATHAGVPINPLAPWLQMGWGYVTGEQAPAIVESLFSGQYPSKPSQAESHMNLLQSIRQALWP
ncbi:MAG TPA: S8/S53 family peptidase [Candidatus Thermoplasmatota archaeon]|nr:S8/S53 family peptidase [Candidatus Thermoplasmatota archaeon]